MKSKTLDVLFFKCKVTLFDDPEEFARFTSKRGILPAADNADGCAVFDNTDAAVFISVEPPRSVKECLYVYSVLVHEATHIVEDIFDFVGEETPGGETRAYLTEKICKCLFELYSDMHHDFEIMPIP